MKGILITSDSCPPCSSMKEHFADLIASGEIEEKNIDTDPEEVAGMIEKYSANIPSLLIVTDAGELLTIIQDEES